MLTFQGRADGETLSQSMSHLTGDLELAIDEIRRISHNLHPKILDDLGFSSAVRSLSQEFLQRTHVAMRCELEDIPPSLSREAELAIYRIIQEALQNVEKHSSATSVMIHATHHDSSWIIRIRDNGRGFTQDNKTSATSPNPSGLGLTTMKERARLIGGSLEIQSSLNEGTVIVFEIPFD